MLIIIKIGLSDRWKLVRCARAVFLNKNKLQIEVYNNNECIIKFCSSIISGIRKLYLFLKRGYTNP